MTPQEFVFLIRNITSLFTKIFEKKEEEKLGKKSKNQRFQSKSKEK